jgi:chromosomal replication initiation ATPase DnaA
MERKKLSNGDILARRNFINRFKREFKQQFGDDLIVYHSIPPKEVQILSTSSNILDIEKVVCDAFSTTPDNLKKKSRKREIVMARHTFYYACEKAGFGCSEPSRHLEQDHTTAIHGQRTAKDLIDTQDLRLMGGYKEFYNKMKSKIPALEI